MRPSSDLHTLIRSLTPAEKRYFKLFSSMQGKKKNYLELFDAIAAQEEYDESALKEEFAGERFLRQFNVAKKYLYDLIVRSLTYFHAASTVGSQVRDLLRGVEVLYERALNDLALKSVEKAITLAEEVEEYPLLLDALAWKRRILADDIDSPENVDRIVLPQIEAAGRFMDYLENEILFYRVRALAHGESVRSEKIRKALQKLMESPLLSDDRSDRSFLSRLLQEQVWLNYYVAFGFEARTLAYEHAKRRVELLESAPAMVEEYPALYTDALGDRLMTSRIAGDHAGFLRYLDEMKEIAPDILSRRRIRYPRTSASIFRSFTSRYLGALQVYGRFDDVLQLRDIIEEQQDLYRDFIHPHYRASHLLHIANGCYALGDPAGAIDAVSRTIRLCEEEGLEKIAMYARFNAMIYYYERGDIDYLEHLVRTVRHALKNSSDDARHPGMIVDFFDRLPSIADEKEIARFCDETQKRLLAIELEPVELDLHRYFGYAMWMYARSRSKTYLEVHREYVAVHWKKYIESLHGQEAEETSMLLRSVHKTAPVPSYGPRSVPGRA